MCEVLDRVENRGLQKGIIQGEDTILTLMRYLLSNGRTEDAKKRQRIRHIEISCSQKFLGANNKLKMLVLLVPFGSALILKAVETTWKLCIL